MSQPNLGEAAKSAFADLGFEVTTGRPRYLDKDALKAGIQGKAHNWEARRLTSLDSFHAVGTRLVNCFHCRDWSISLETSVDVALYCFGRIEILENT